MVEGNSGWSWTKNVSTLDGGNQSLTVWARFGSDTWSEGAEVVIETLAVPNWMEEAALMSVAFDPSHNRYEVDGLIGKRFGKDTPASFPDWLEYRDGERTWNGIYAGLSVEAYATLSGRVITEEALPVVGMSFLGIDLPLKLNFGTQAEKTIDLFDFIKACKDEEDDQDKNEAESYKKRSFSPQVTFSYESKVALDEQLKFTQFQFDVGMGLTASGTAFSVDLPSLYFTIPAVPAVSIVVTPEIGWSPVFEVGMGMSVDTQGDISFDTFDVYLGAEGMVGVSAELAIAGGLAQGGVKATGGLGLGFQIEYVKNDPTPWTFSIPLGLELDFSFVGSLLWGWYKGEFPIWHWEYNTNLWSSGGGAAAMAALGMEPQVVGHSEATPQDLLANGAIVRSDSGQIGYAWTALPLEGTTASALSFQQQSAGVWGQPEQVIGSEHHRGQPALVSLGEDRWMLLWAQSNLPADQLDGLTGEEVMASQEIWYAVRQTSGWGPAQRLTDNGTCDDSPAVVARTDGTVMAVWRRMFDIDMDDVGDSNLVYAVWDNDQDTWSLPGVLADTEGLLADPDLALLPDGKIVATWLSDTKGYWDESNPAPPSVEENEGEELTGGVRVWAAANDGTTWSTPVEIGGWEDGRRAWPQVVALPDGRALALWTEERPKGTVLMTALRDPGTGDWGGPVPATDPERMVGKPDVVVDGSIVRVVYNGYSEMGEFTVDMGDDGVENFGEVPAMNEIVVISRDFADPNGAWSEPEPLSQEGETAWWGSMAVDGNGDLQAKYVVGTELEDGWMSTSPDLKVSDGDLVLGTAPLVPGVQNAVEARIVNRGQAASGVTTVVLYDGDPSAGGTLLVQEPLSALAIGQSTTVSLPWTPADPGRYALFVVVDDQAVVSELKEDNNTAEITAGAISAPTVILSPASDTGLLGDGRTTDANPEMMGAAASATNVALFVDTQDWPVAYADVDQHVYSVVLPELGFGLHTVWVQAFDQFGDGSPMSEPFELFIEAATDVEPVAWLELDAGSDRGELGDGLTNATRPEINGWGLPNATILLYSGGTLVGEATADGQGGFTVAPTADLADGLHTFTVVQQDQVGNASPASEPLMVTIDATPPTVEQVLLRSTAWSGDFLDDLDSQGLGHPTIPRLGFRLPDGPEQMDALPWTDLDTISIVFSEDVNVTLDEFTLSGQTAGSYAVDAVGFGYDPATFVAGWTFTESIAVDILLLTLSDTVTDPAGSRLDGDWTDGQSEFPSGDGTAGSDFEMSFVVADNRPPTADAGGAYSVAEGGTIQLDASGSTDPDDDPLVYAWDFDGDGQYDDATGATPDFSAAGLDGPTSATVGLRVTDDDGESDTATAEITVTNASPVADPGGPYTSLEGGTVMLGATGSSDPGNDIASYQWDLDGDGVFESNGTFAAFKVDAPGVYDVTLRVTDNDGASDDAATQVTVTEVAPFDLGTVTFDEVSNAYPATHNIWYQIETSQDGMLTVKATPATGTAVLALYDTSRSEPPLVVGWATGSGQRFDYQAGSKESYLVKLTGTSNDVDLTFANLVATEGTEIQVTGTDGPDTFGFAPVGSYRITINGVEYHFDDAQYDKIVFNGGTGNDTATLTGGPDSEIARFFPDHGTFGENGFLVSVNEVTEITAHGGGGYDSAFMYDSPGDDEFVCRKGYGKLSGDGFALETFDFMTNYGYATNRDGGNDVAYMEDTPANDKFKFDWPTPGQFFGKMYGGGIYYNRAKYFEQVDAVMTGGKNVVRLFDSERNETFYGQKEESRLVGDGFDVKVSGYSQLVCYASEGNDIAYLEDSEDDDTTRARPHKITLWGGDDLDPTYELIARRFDDYHIQCIHAGFDRAKLHDTALSEHVDAGADTASLYKNRGEMNLLYEVIAFEWVKLYTTDDGHQDTVKKQDPVNFEFLYDAAMWDEIP